MRILLPPSEGKTPADPNCAPIRLDNLVYPRLTDKRLAVGEALQEASGQPDALTVLSVGPRLVDDVVRNCTLWKQPAAPARDIYTGVLYAGLHYTPAPPGSAPGLISIFLSPLPCGGGCAPATASPPTAAPWGSTCPALAPLAPTGGVLSTAFFTEEMAGELVVDCRSGAYQKAWMPTAKDCHDHNIDLVQVKAVRVVNGREKVVSHNAKRWRGLLTRALVAAGAEGLTIDNPGDLVTTQQTLFSYIRDALAEERLNTARLSGGDGRWTLTLVTE
ncbi:hypothetical protein FACS1894129_5030 [Actinomycetota bacterium]|nr:hypothetical protein FACS1894129_5030 [Actinomycetota bacterium]